MLVQISDQIDFDILFTTDNQTVINSMFKNERVTLYDVPKPKKKPNITEDDLFNTDTFSFGQQIGPLTNISSTIYALLPLFTEDSKEYEVLMSRLKQCCVNQSKQIDKTKIGAAVKCIPKIWNTYQHAQEDETEEQRKEREFYNSILADKKPYFFRYKYNQTDKDYRHYIKKQDEACIVNFGSDITLDVLLAKPEAELSEQEKVFLDYYYRLLPVTDTDCVMNKICHYIEGIDFNIKKKVRSSFGFDYTLLQSEGFEKNQRIYALITEIVARHMKKWAENKKVKDKTKPDEGFDKMAAYTSLREELETISSNDEIIVNHLITLFYEDKPSYNKNILWDMYGKTIFNILKSKTNVAYFPQKNPNGSLEFLDERYSIEKVVINQPTEANQQNETEVSEDEEIELFDNIKEESIIDD